MWQRWHKVRIFQPPPVGTPEESCYRGHAIYHTRTENRNVVIFKKRKFVTEVRKMSNIIKLQLTGLMSVFFCVWPRDSETTCEICLPGRSVGRKLYTLEEKPFDRTGI